MKRHNFSAGPCILPPSVFKKASEAVLNFNHSGLSILEISHRSKDFVAIYEKAQHLVKKLLNLDDSYEILFLQGGASLQFAMVPLNLMAKENGLATYLNTGTWADKAIKEAKKLGRVEEISHTDYTSIPKTYTINPQANYWHCTSNNTIYGTQMKSFPQTDIPLVCDMSSDIFSRNIAFNSFDLIYAGAQKNIGPAGSTLVIVKKDILGKTQRDILSYLDYKVHIEKKGIFNTSPVFAIYTAMLNLQWLDEQGGISAIEKINEIKAELLYQEIDRNPLFVGYANKDDRSTMNATFYLKDKSIQNTFDKIWENAGINGLHGHRSVGGYRASMYNALPLESVQVLVDCMQALEKAI